MEEILRRCDAPVGRKGNLCGERIPDDLPFKFSIEGTDYESDICEKHRDDFREKIETYLSIATPVKTRAGSAVRAAMKGKHGVFTTKDVRNWLREQGVEVADSGRLPKEQIEQYVAAHS